MPKTISGLTRLTQFKEIHSVGFKIISLVTMSVTTLSII